MSRANVEYLREHGPAGYSELPNDHLDVRDRQEGAARLHVGSGAGTRRPDAVAFLFNEHEPGEVLETWFEVNEDYVEEAGYDKVRGQFTAVGRPWSLLASEHLETPDRPWEPRTEQSVSTEDESDSQSMLDRLLSWGGSP